MENQVSFPANISLQGRIVRSMEEALQILHDSSRDEIYPLAMQMKSEILGCIESGEDYLYTLHEFVQRGEFWRGHEDEDSFRHNWRAARDAIANRTKRLEYIDSIREKSIKTWGKDNAKAFFLRIKTRAMAEQTSKLLSTNLDYPAIRLMINNEIAKRLSANSRGIKKDKAVMQGDIAKAFSNRCLRPLSVEKFRELGLEMDIDGYCCPVGSGRGLSEIELEDNNNHSNEFVSNSYDNLSRESSREFSQERRQESLPIPNMSCQRGKKRKRKEFSQCGCLLTDKTLRRVLTPNEIKDDRHCQKSLRKVGRKIYKNYDGIDTNSLCSSHSRQFCSQIGILVNISHKERTDRLDKLYHGLGSWEETRARYSNWFRQAESNETPISTYRFQEKNIRPIVENWGSLKHLTFQSLYRRCFGKSPLPSLKQPDNLMQEKGNVVIPGFFGWLKYDFDGKHPGGLLRLALLEFAMYDWHFRPCTNHPRLGFARNMWYSLVQQLVRQDIVYWMWHVYFRPDHMWRLISVPDVATSTYPGEHTCFQHLDISVRDFLDIGYGKNFLQSSVSIDDEDYENCGELLLDMNRHLESWMNDVSSRGATRDGNIQQIISELWSSEDVVKYGIDWVKQICQATDVRFSLPGLPHRSTNPATAQRHTITAQFVGISYDHSTLDIAELGPREELSQGHRDFIPAERPRQTNDNSDDDMRAIFPGTFRLCGLGAVSDALVGRERWTNAETIQMVNLLFGLDENVAWKYIQDWRENAFTQYVAAFDRMVETEKVTYGENSFFNRVEAELSTQPAFMQGDKFDDGNYTSSDQIVVE